MPYNQDKDIYDGYAFSCSKSLRPQPSLANIIKEIERSYPDNLGLDRLDWSYLVKQGVFSINTALSTKLKTPGAHKEIWASFTKYWIESLTSNYRDICFLLWGSHAQEYEQYVAKDMGHHIIKTTHPSPFSCSKSSKTAEAFLGSNCFIKVNEYLNAVNKHEIVW